MKKIASLFAAMFVAVAVMSAQEKALRKYTVMDDVKTTTISKGLISLLPTSALQSFGIGKVLDRIESVQVISTDKKKIAKKMFKKLPKELMKEDFEIKVKTKQTGKDICIMQSTTDIDKIVVIMSELPTSTIFSVKGNFADMSFESLIE